MGREEILVLQNHPIGHLYKITSCTDFPSVLSRQHATLRAWVLSLRALFVQSPSQPSTQTS